MWHNSWTIAKRELGSLFSQPIAYIIAIVLLLICGFVFAGSISSYFATAQLGQQPPPPSIANVMGFFLFLSLFIVPAITMRLLAEEQKSGTMELLLTLPIRDGEIIAGKFIAAFLYYLILICLTIVYPAAFLRFGNPDIGPILTIYLGVVLAIGAMISLGVLASAVARNQVVAYMLSLGLILLLYLMDFFALLVDTNNGTVRAVMEELSFQGQIIGFIQGVIEVKAIIYYLAVTVVALFAAVRVLESKRWR